MYKRQETIKLEYNKFNVNKLNDFVIDVSFGISQIIYFISLILGSYLVSMKIISPGIMVGASQLITNISGPFHNLSLIHISEPTRQCCTSRMPSSA